jgi:hypothetical protein
MNTITVENTNYEFQDIPGKGKCLVPIKVAEIPFIVGGVYCLIGACYGRLIKTFTKEGNTLFSMLQCDKSGEVYNYITWSDYSDFTEQEMKNKMRDRKVTYLNG